MWTGSSSAAQSPLRESFLPPQHLSPEAHTRKRATTTYCPEGMAVGDGGPEQGGPPPWAGSNSWGTGPRSSLGRSSVTPGQQNLVAGLPVRSVQDPCAVLGWPRLGSPQFPYQEGERQ